MKKIILPIMLVIMILPLCVVKADKVDKVIYQTSFETEEERNFWDLTGDLDGDGRTWEYKSFETNALYTAKDGIYSLYSASEQLTPDNLAISSLITMDSYNVNQYIRLTWHAAAQHSGYYDEQYSVYIFKGNETTENIKNAIKNNTVEAIYNETLSEKTRYNYHSRSVDIKEYLNELYGNSDEKKTVRIVFRHHNSVDNAALKIDLVSIERMDISYNIKNFSFTENLEGWTTIDYDGDGHNWEHKTNDDSTEGGNNESNFLGNFSDGVIASASYFTEALTPKNYIISPKIKIDSKYDVVELGWYVASAHNTWYSEHYSVYVYSGTEELTKENIKEKLANESISQQLLNEKLSTHKFTLKTSQLDKMFTGKEVRIIFAHETDSAQDWIKIDDVALYGYLPDEETDETPSTEEKVVLGDWNSDGEFNLVDLIAYRIYLIGGDMSKYYTGEITEELKTKIDLNADKEINLLDLISARKILVGLPIN